VDAVTPGGGVVVGVPLNAHLENDLPTIAARVTARTRAISYGQKIETAQRRQCSNIFGLGPVLHNKLAVDA
jgi:hypothetical protein